MLLLLFGKVSNVLACNSAGWTAVCWGSGEGETSQQTQAQLQTDADAEAEAETEAVRCGGQREWQLKCNADVLQAADRRLPVWSPASQDSLVALGLAGGSVPGFPGFPGSQRPLDAVGEGQ